MRACSATSQVETVCSRATCPRYSECELVGHLSRDLHIDTLWRSPSRNRIIFGKSGRNLLENGDWLEAKTLKISLKRWVNISTWIWLHRPSINPIWVKCVVYVWTTYQTSVYSKVRRWLFNERISYLNHQLPNLMISDAYIRLRHQLELVLVYNERASRAITRW